MSAPVGLTLLSLCDRNQWQRNGDNGNRCECYASLLLHENLLLAFSRNVSPNTAHLKTWSTGRQLHLGVNSTRPRAGIARPAFSS